MQDFTFAKLKTNTVVLGILRKTLFPPSLVSCLGNQLFLPSKTSMLQTISKEKHSVKPLCWNVNRNCDIDVAIKHACYQSENRLEKNSSSGFLSG